MSQLQRCFPRSEASQLHTRLPRPEHQRQEEEAPEHLAVKISRDFVIKVRLKAVGNPDISLKGLHTV